MNSLAHAIGSVTVAPLVWVSVAVLTLIVAAALLWLVVELRHRASREVQPASREDEDRKQERLARLAEAQRNQTYRVNPVQNPRNDDNAGSF